jgi:succinate dehydrogenase flavin-adding protein (antitoxin of CptAB toxin-antitoxin module)
MNLSTKNSSRKNQLRYHASYRGCKENELVLREFCDLYLDEMNEEELYLFEEVLKIEDTTILDYLYNRIDLKNDELFNKNKLLRKILEKINKK